MSPNRLGRAVSAAGAIVLPWWSVVPAPVAAQDPVITEFMADNASVLTDASGGTPDWIELHNPSAEDVDLEGWRLRDSDGEWAFPATVLPAGGFLVVLASGGEGVPGPGELHADFRLDASGEPLALLRPDGSVAFEFADPVPTQREDVSFGIQTDSVSLVDGRAPARILVPSSPVGETWRSDPAFDDAGWISGRAAVGFNLDPGPVLGTGGAVTTAYQVPEGTTGNQAYGGALGMDFTVEAPVQVTHLGVFDSGSDGIATLLTAQLWLRDDRGTPGNAEDDTGVRVLASEMFSPADPGEPEGGSRFKALASPLVLEPGAYTIVAYGYGASEQNGNQGSGASGEWETDDGGGALRFTGGGRYGTAGTFPASVDGGPVNRYAAGSLRFQSITDRSIETDLRDAMAGVSATALMRIPFSLAAPDAVETLELTLGFDDGFVAWINGAEVARRNAPAVPAHDSTATAAGNAVVSIPIAATPGLLRPGANVLAIQGLNLSAADRDFILAPSLRAVATDARTLRFFTRATPGEPNDPSGVAGFVADTRFSVDRGFFESPIEVVVSTATEGAEIRYTTDGSLPTKTAGLVYDGPITIGSTTVLRAAAFREGFEPSNVDTQTYLFLGDVAVQDGRPAGYPTSWAGVAADYGMDPDPSEYARAAGNPAFSSEEARAAIVESLRALPTLSIVTDPGALFDGSTGIYLNPAARGRAWERPVSVELILPDGSGAFQEDAGLRVSGFSSRNLSLTPKLNFRLFFRREYGAGTLDYPFFGPDGTDRIDTIALRGNVRDAWVAEYHGFGSATYIGDEWAKRAQLEMGQPAVRGTFVHLYLNGFYWGLYNPTERPDAAFAEAHFGGDRDDYDAVKFCCPHRVVDGTITSWNDLLSASRAGLVSDAAYQRVLGNHPDGSPNPATPPLLDVDNFIDYVINGQYHASGDWPGNYYVIRDRVPGRTTGFRFFTWDNDLVFYNGNPNAGNKVQTDPGHNWWTQSPGEVDIAIRRNAEYRVRFADRVYRHYHHGGALTPERNLARWNELATLVRPALFAESARWGDAKGSPLRTVQDHWDRVAERMVTRFFPGRQAVVLAQLRAQGLYPSLAAPEFSRHGGTVSPDFGLQFTAPAPVYYTLDGSDPRLPGGGIDPSARMAAPAGVSSQVVVPAGAPATAWVPTDGSLGASWTMPGFDDGTWMAGTTGVGLENGNGYQELIGLDVFEAAFGVNASVYVRVPFPGAAPGAFTSLTLRLKYDDGFIAYLNGVEVASANRPANPAWNSSADGAHPDQQAVEFEDFDLTPHLDLLRPDGNVLAIHGLNAGPGSADLLILPQLEAVGLGAGSAVELAGTGVVRARSFDGREWSPLNEATFIVGNGANAGELAVSEIHYHPGAPTAEEAAAGFAESDFEFVELVNLAGEPLDLTGVRFTDGISFDFTGSEATVLAPGARVLVVADRAAFLARFGAHLAPRIAGTFADGTRLSNAGELLVMVDADGEPITAFAWDDGFPWPEAADGSGHSLTWRGNPSLDPSDPDAWRGSVNPGGSPGAGDAVLLQGDPGADTDGDGLIALVEHAFGSDHETPSTLPVAVRLAVDAHLEVAATLRVAADDVHVAAETSVDLATWSDADLERVSESAIADGRTIVTWRSATPMTMSRFVRWRIERRVVAPQ